MTETNEQLLEEIKLLLLRAKSEDVDDTVRARIGEIAIELIRRGIEVPLSKP